MADRPIRKSDGTRQENPTKVLDRFYAADGDTPLTLIQSKSGRSRTSAKQLLSSGRVSVNGRITTLATETLRAGDVLTVHSGTKPEDFRHPLIEKVWEDESLLVVYKRAGIATVNTSHKDRTATAIWILSQALKKEKGADAKLFMLNRLDKNSEGYVIFAKTVPAKELMVKQWGNLLKDQRYLLCIEGRLPAKEGTLTHESKTKEGQIAKTVSAEYRVLKTGKAGGLAIVEVHVRGARLYNLRTLVRENGLAIYGDVRSRSGYKTDIAIGLIQTKLSFLHPITKELLSFDRKFPTHLYDLLKTDRGEGSSVTLTRRPPKETKGRAAESDAPKFWENKGRRKK